MVVYNPDDQTLKPQLGPAGELQAERMNVHNGINIYDAATWQIAVKKKRCVSSELGVPGILRSGLKARCGARPRLSSRIVSPAPAAWSKSDGWIRPLVTSTTLVIAGE
jgi:hypothetical protein